MTDDIIDEEIERMHGEKAQTNSISSKVFKQPIKTLKLPALLMLDKKSSVLDAIELMKKNKQGAVIITEKGKVIGIVTERDIIRKVINEISDYKKTNITQIMTEDPVRLMEDDMIAHVIHNMHLGGYRHIPIVNQEDEPVSIVSIKHINSFVFAHFPKTIYNITSIPFRGKSKREDA